MNNKRRDVLRKGIDVTLYPLPFRKGGKIMNAGMGDKTVKPGIEYAGGGGLPRINDLGRTKVASDATRTVNPRAQATAQGITHRPTEILHKTTTGLFNYTTPGIDMNRMVRPKSKFALGGVMTGGGGGGTEPSFKTEDEFVSFHRKKRLEELRKQEPELYAKMSGSPEDLDSLIALRGGLPKWTPPARVVSATTPTDWANLGFEPQSTGGFQYDKDKPAKGSITNIGLGRRLGKFGQ